MDAEYVSRSASEVALQQHKHVVHPLVICLDNNTTKTMTMEEDER